MHLKSLDINRRDVLGFGFGALILLLYYSRNFYNTENVLIFASLCLCSAFGLVMVMKYKQLLLLILSFLVPLSVSVQAPGGAEISAPSELICILLSAFFLVKIVTGVKISKFFLYHPVTLFILLDLAWLLTTSLSSELPIVSFKRLSIKLLFYITFYFLYFELFSVEAKNVKRIFLLQSLGLLIPIGSTIAFQSTLGFSTMGSQQACRPFYNDHTMYGAILVFFIPFIFIQSTRKYNRGRSRLIYIVLLLIFIIAAYLSFSRAAWISLIIATLVGISLRVKIKLRHILVLFFIAAAAVALNYNSVSDYFSRNKELSHGNDVSQHFKSVSNINSDASNLERINRWKCAFRMFIDKPLMGFGPGTYQFFYGKYQVRQELTRISTFSGTKGHAHSEYLNYLSETGLPGLIIFCLLIGSVLFTAIRVFTRTTDKTDKDTILYILLGLITFYIHAFFNGFLEFDKLAMPVYSSMAAIVFLDRKLRLS